MLKDSRHLDHSGIRSRLLHRGHANAVLVRQVLGAIAQFDKASTVAKLAAARNASVSCQGRCEGRKPLSTTRPEVVALARKLRRRKPKGGQLSLRGVAGELAARGFLNERGKPYAAKSIASMLCQDCC